MDSDNHRPWWDNGKVRLKLCSIYRAKGMIKDFVDAILPPVRESLYIETIQQKVILGYIVAGEYLLFRPLSLSCFREC